MLPKALLRVSRRGGGYQPRFAGPDAEPLAGRVLGTIQGHVGSERATLEEALTDLEREADDHRLVRGLAELVRREATFEVQAPREPRQVRRVVFAAAEAEPEGVVTTAERRRALEAAGADLDLDPEAVAAALHADRPERTVLVDPGPRWEPATLVRRYDLSLAQTALFDALEVRVRSSDVRRLVAAAKREGLLYEVEVGPEGRTLVLTGPDAVFRATRRYGTAFARLLRSVVGAESWELVATVDDDGTERTMELSDADPLSVPGDEPTGEPSYDSAVERDLATRFAGLDLDWELVREPDPLAAGDHLMVPDFGLEYRPPGHDGPPVRRVYLEVMGFWTPEYVQRKLEQVAALDPAVDLVVAVDESLNAGEALADRDARVVTYRDRVPIGPVRAILRDHEAEVAAERGASLPETLVPADDVVTLATLAKRHAVPETVLEDRTFPEHKLVGRTLVRPAVLEAVDDALEVGQDLATVEDVLGGHDLTDTGAVLAALGYAVDWAGLTGGTLRRRPLPDTDAEGR